MAKVIFEIPDELREKMKQVIEERGMTIRSFLVKLIEKELKK